MAVLRHDCPCRPFTVAVNEEALDDLEAEIDRLREALARIAYDLDTSPRDHAKAVLNG